MKTDPFSKRICLLESYNSNEGSYGSLENSQLFPTRMNEAEQDEESI
jgi:hypothetical protein